MGDVTEADIGKPIFTAGERNVGTLGGIDGPTLYIEIAEDIDDDLLSDMKISQTTGLKNDDGTTLAGTARAAVADVTDDAIRFWPAYAAESEHESVSDEETPKTESNEVV